MLISVHISGFKSLRMYTQGCQGCQKIINFVKNTKILIARSTIQPKLSKIKNNLPLLINFDTFLNVFLISLNFGWMVDLAMSIFEFLTKFLVFWHPWVYIRSDLKPLFETDMSDSSYSEKLNHTQFICLRTLLKTFINKKVWTKKNQAHYFVSTFETHLIWYAVGLVFWFPPIY